ncbi:sugar/nucleoside kinase (ribokinase family) [Bradyrhizobium sp. GM6.1]
MLISCGDALIDFVPTRNTDRREAVMPAVGGSCLNVAIGMARLGAPTGFVGGISTDMFGRMITDHAAASNVELGLATRSDQQTTLAFVRIIARESHYAFYDARDRDAELDLPARLYSLRYGRSSPCRLDHAGQ